MKEPDLKKIRKAMEKELDPKRDQLDRKRGFRYRFFRRLRRFRKL